MHASLDTPGLVVVSDPIEGPTLIVAGSRPFVWRVLAPKPNSLTEYACESIEGQAFSTGELWPEVITAPLRQYPTARIVPASLLRSVDLLFVWSGSGYRYTYSERYYLWQVAQRPELRLIELGPRALRSARHQRRAIAGVTKEAH